MSRKTLPDKFLEKRNAPSLCPLVRTPGQELSDKNENIHSSCSLIESGFLKTMLLLKQSRTVWTFDVVLAGSSYDIFEGSNYGVLAGSTYGILAGSTYGILAGRESETGRAANGSQMESAATVRHSDYQGRCNRLDLGQP